MNVLGTPFFSAGGNFENWLSSSEGRLFIAAIVLSIVVILYYVYYVRMRRRPWRVGGRPGHGETSPRDEENENERR